MRRLLTLLALILSLQAHAEPTTDAQCLASAIVYEAGGEPLLGKRAVYEVILNRAKESRSSVCGIVTAPGQFSWYGFKPLLPVTNEMLKLLRMVKAHSPVLPPATKWFFTTTIKMPKWARQMECLVVGNHRFCRKKEEENE